MLSIISVLLLVAWSSTYALMGAELVVLIAPYSKGYISRESTHSVGAMCPLQPRLDGSLPLPFRRYLQAGLSARVGLSTSPVSLGFQIA